MKKKKDGLIKGMIAAAIIFVVGFILTVCFGAYLGADAVRHIASGETFEEFVEERFPNIDFDDGQTVNESQTEKSMLPSGSTLEISAPYGDIKIKASDSTEVRCVLKQANDSGAKLDLSDDKIILDGGSTYGIAELTVYLPKSVTLLTVSNNNGDIDIDGVNLSMLTINSVSGDIDLSDITAERGKIKSSAGETEISETAVFTKMLEVNQSFGDIEIDVPRDPDKIKFIISSETPLDEKSTCDSYLLSLAKSTDGKAEYSVNVKNGELSVKNSDD